MSSVEGSKDDDTDKQSSTTDTDAHSSHSNHDPWVLQDKINSVSSLDNSNNDLFFGEEHLEGEGPLNVLESPERAKRDSHLAKAAVSNTASSRSSSQYTTCIACVHLPTIASPYLSYVKNPNFFKIRKIMHDQFLYWV